MIGGMTIGQGRSVRAAWGALTLMAAAWLCVSPAWAAPRSLSAPIGAPSAVGDVAAGNEEEIVSARSGYGSPREAGAAVRRAVERADLKALERSVRMSEAVARTVEGRERAMGRLLSVLERFPLSPLSALPAEVEAGVDRLEATLRTTVDGRPVEYVVRFVNDPARGWVADAAELDEIDRTYEELGIAPLVSGLRSVGAGMLVDGSALGLRYYQWLGLFVLVFLAVVFDFALRGMTHLVTRRQLKKQTEAEVATETAKLIRRVAKPVGFAGGAAVVYWLLPTLNLPIAAEAVLRLAAKAAGLSAGVLAAYRLVDVLAEHMGRRAAKTHSRFDDLLVPLVRKAAKVFIVAFGLLFLAESFDLPIASIIAGLGIGGLAFAFAAKDTIENLFGSVAVILDRPFAVGDWVVIEGVEGTVEDLGFRSTRIRTFYNSLVTVPNASLVRAKVDNYGRRAFRRYRTVLSLTYDTPADRVEAFCEGVREIVRRHPYTRKDFFEVHMNDFGAHSLDVLVYIFFRTPDWSTELRERHRFCLDVLRLAHKLGVEFAFPTQTLHLSRATPSDPFSGRGEEDEMRSMGRTGATEVMEGAEFQRRDV